MLNFNFGGKVSMRSLMAVLVGRNGRIQVFYQEEWNPDKNPGFQTLKVKNQVEIHRDPRYRDMVEVVVSDKFGHLKPWDIRNGSLIFRSYGRITIDIVDHKDGEKQSFLICYEADREGTFHAKLAAESIVRLNPKEKPLTANPELPEELRPAKSEPTNGDNGHSEQPRVAPPSDPDPSDIAGTQIRNRRYAF